MHCSTCRLNSTAVKLQNTADGSAVNVTYVSDGKVHRVQGRHAIFAGYHSLLPHVCPELPDNQTEAINSVTKVPLVYISIAVRNWKAWENLSIRSVTCAQPSLMHSFGMDFQKHTLACICVKCEPVYGTTWYVSRDNGVQAEGQGGLTISVFSVAGDFLEICRRNNKRTSR